MTLMTRRENGPLAGVFDWIDALSPMGADVRREAVPVEEFLSDGTYVLRADLPGIDPARDVEVTVDRDVLSIHGERRHEEHDMHRTELRYGSFTRRFRLPPECHAEDIAAAYADGVLEVRVPLTEQDAPPVQVPVERKAE